GRPSRGVRGRPRAGAPGAPHAAGRGRTGGARSGRGGGRCGSDERTVSALKAIQDRLEQSSGLSFRGHQGERLVAVIEATAREEGASLDALAARLAADRVLVDELVARLVVHESHFLRDRSQMDLIRSVLADLARTTSHRIRIWSAGCAGGEEAHTLALLGVEAGLGGRLRVLGTDVSAPAIERARAGRYSAWSLRSVPDDVAARWFHHHAGTMVVREDARSLVRFEVRNLLDPPGGRFDLVLCRNVLMYLTPDA